MENILQGLPQVFIYLDDVLITGSTEEEHLSYLEQVLKRLEQAGLRLKESKCLFLKSTIKYLGHNISSDGLQPNEDKTAAILSAPVPLNVSQLRSFLGAVNYYRKFLPNVSTVLSPLYRLLEHKAHWHWGKKEQKSFEEVKRLLGSPCLLTHYDPDKPLLLAADASHYGIGAVLSH